MAAETLETLAGNYKDQFHKDVEDLIPKFALLNRGMIDWVPADKMNGEFYSVPTVLRSNQGVTYFGESGATGTLTSAKPGQMKEAQVKGSEMNVRGQIAYKALSQAASAGPRAFKKASSWLVEDLQNVAYARLEIAALHGQLGLGEVESATDLTGGVANIVITEATFAPGLWVLLEGATLDSFTSTTKNNASGVLTVTLVTTSTRTVKVTFTGTLADEVDPGDNLYFEGANAGSGSFKEMVGLIKQFSATSGTLFNIDRGAYSLVQGNSYDAAGPISKAKLVEASMLAVDKGCMSDLVCLVSTKAWSALAADDMALRVFDDSYDPAQSKSGSRELIYESINGQIKVVCHPMMKAGQALIFNPDDVIWVGSAKPTFSIPGQGDKFFRIVENTNAVEFQNYSDCAIYALKPSQGVYVSGITYA